MKEKIESIRQAIGEGMLQVHDRKQLFELKMQFLGKTGEISALSKGMRDIPPEQRPEAGKLVGEIRTWAEEQFAAREEQLKAEELSARYASERVDVTMPARFAGTGSVHPVSLVRQELIDIFAGMGFDIYEGPEIEQDYYNFQALNISRPSRCSARAGCTAPTPTPPIRPCSTRWKGWSSTAASPSTTSRAA